MGLQAVRISVGHTWRFVVDGKVTVSHDLSGYRQRLDALKSGTSRERAELPWPPYRSRFWTHMLNGSYQDTRSPDLVAALLPLRQHDWLPPIDRCQGRVGVEVFEHPFAVTTLLHLDLEPVDPWPDQVRAAELVQAVLTAPFETGTVRDGLLPGTWWSPPAVDTRGLSVTAEDAGRCFVLSALHDEADARVPASALASHFDDLRPGAAAPLRSEGGAVRVDGDTVGLVLPRDLPRAGQRLGCLHHNVAALLAYLQNLLTLTPASVVQTGVWYQTQAALLANLLYRRAPLPSTGTIYRSRVPQLWLDERRRTPFVNALTDPGLPPLPTPD